MGNQSSSSSSDSDSDSDPELLDYVVTQYILSLNFDSLRNLFRKEYCDELVLLTSDIVDRHFTDTAVSYLAQQRNMEREAETEKKHGCMAIAQFYVKVAHLFAALITTINPIYVYQDTNGNTVKATLREKDQIPAEFLPQITMQRLNLCSHRLESLQQGCQQQKETLADKEESLAEEPGIPELKELYMDSQYDWDSGTFLAMSPSTELKFKSDLELFYRVFTGSSGSSPMPSTIRGFSDIKVTDYCSTSDPTQVAAAAAASAAASKNPFLLKYAAHLKDMIRRTNEHQSVLLEVINELFVYAPHPISHEKQIRVHPRLTPTSLQHLIEKARQQIVELYLTCESDYVEGLKLYEAIVEYTIFETAHNQLTELHALSDQLVLSPT